MTYNEVVGDVDYDYTDDFKDLMLALKAVVNKSDLNKADMNGDGNVDLIDCICIMETIVK